MLRVTGRKKRICSILVPRFIDGRFQQYEDTGTARTLRPFSRRHATGESLNLDFHSLPYFGQHPLVESHYLSKRSRRQPSILTFLAQDADSQVFCYSNADIRKGEESEEVFRFIKFWTRQHGSPPEHLVFDS